MFKKGLLIEKIYFPTKSSQIPNRPVVTLVILPPEQGDPDEAKLSQFVESMTRQCGSSDRTFKTWGCREFVVKDCDGRLLAFGANLA